MQTSTFKPRSPESLQAIRFGRDGERGSRTLGNNVEQLHLPVPSGRALASAVAAVQKQAFADAQGSQGPLGWNDVQDGRGEVPSKALKPVRDWLRSRGLPSRGHGATLLAAHEVVFHHDPIFAHIGPFLVWHLAGPSKALDFPQLGLSYFFEAGDAVVFDGATPHGLQLPQFAGKPFDAQGMRHPPAGPEEVSVYVSLDMRWCKSLEALLGVRRTRDSLAMDAFEVEPTTGEVKEMVTQ